MKKLILFAVLVVLFFIWLKDFFSSGKFQNFLDEHSNSDWAPKVQSTVGEICYTLGSYEKATENFQKVIENYPKSPYVAEAEFKVGCCYQSMEQFDKAREIYKKILKERPEGKYKDTILKKLNYLEP